MRKIAFVLIAVLLAGFAFIARCWNVRDVFVDGRIYFTEADAYARMTRARLVDRGDHRVIRHHDFENWPAGTTPHTTAPMDWAIVAVRKLVDLGLATMDRAGTSVLRREPLDVAGALVGPLLGLIAVFGVAVALPRRDPRDWSGNLAALLIFAVSPILVHGTLLGRPDHQALLVVLLSFSLAIEFRLLQQTNPAWAIAGGVSWGLALWVSLYEPMILLVLTALGLAVWHRESLFQRQRRVEGFALLIVVVIALLIDGWRVQLPDPTMREAFGRWKLSIGEMQPLAFQSGVLWRWLGWGILLAPIALAWQARHSRESRLALWLLLAVAGLAFWQIRWAYFLGVVFALTLPLQLKAIPKGWLANIVFIIALWPLAQEWDERLFPDDVEQRQRAVAIREQVALRQIAEIQGEHQAGPFIAPWWLSPAIAYWSNLPGVAGSSHQSLPGIMDTARVYLASDATAVLPILQQRQVAWILSDAPERMIPTSAQLLGVTASPETLANKLAEPLGNAATAPLILDQTVPRAIFQVWRVPPTNLTPPRDPADGSSHP